MAKKKVKKTCGYRQGLNSPMLTVINFRQKPQFHSWILTARNTTHLFLEM